MIISTVAENQSNKTTSMEAISRILMHRQELINRKKEHKTRCPRAMTNDPIYLNSKMDNSPIKLINTLLIMQEIWPTTLQRMDAHRKTTTTLSNITQQRIDSMHMIMLKLARPMPTRKPMKWELIRQKSQIKQEKASLLGSKAFLKESEFILS